MKNKDIQLLIIPGLGGSGEDHWQSFWLKEFNNATVVVQDNWNEPQLDEWLTKLNDAILKHNSSVILVAHSLAVSLVLHWSTIYSNSNVKGVLLVAPADVDSPQHTPEIVRGFATMPISKLYYPSIVVASEDDNFVSLKRAKYFSEEWGSDFINIGSKGHINSESNLQSWKEGKLILQQLIDKIEKKKS